MTPTLDKALQALRAGDRLGAEKIAADGLRAVEATNAPGSLAVAQANFDLASILVGVGDLGRAIDQMRRACELSEDTDDARRERLTFLMNLGELLQRAGRLEEAEKVHREGLEGRAAYYGETHPGYAFGLEPLAEVLLTQRRFDDAQPVLARCVEIFTSDRHPRLPGAIVLEASCIKAVAPDEACLERLAGAGQELLHGVVDAALQKAEMAMQGLYDPAVWLGVLADLRGTLVDGGWTDAASLTHLVAATSNLARRAGRHDEQAAAFRWLIAHLDASGDRAKALEAVLGLGLALSQAGDHEGAEAAYRDAAERAENAGPIARSGVLRNFGLYLSEQDRREDAEPLLRQAVEIARGAWGGGGEMLGRALVALGIFVQHAGTENPAALDEAAKMLGEALETLAPDHPDALPARSHLFAIQNGGGCGCGDMDSAISRALAEMVQKELPEGLLNHIAYGADGLKVDLAREPSADEMELLDRVIHQAMAQLRKRIREGYG